MSKPFACSKYKPKYVEGSSGHDAAEPLKGASHDGAFVVARREIIADTPLLQNLSSAAASGADSTRLFGHSPAPLRAPPQVESSALSPYGLSPSRAVPPSYDARHWRSVTHNEFQPYAERACLGKESQLELGRAMRTSHITLGEGANPAFAGTPHTRDAFPCYRSDDYRSVVSMGIGGPASAQKTHSHVVVGEGHALPGQYESAFQRQFRTVAETAATLRASQPLGAAAASGSAVTAAQTLKANKRDMTASHWTLGADSATDYRTVSATPMPSEAPKIKNARPGSSSSALHTTTAVPAAATAATGERAGSRQATPPTSTVAHAAAHLPATSSTQPTSTIVSGGITAAAAAAGGSSAGASAMMGKQLTASAVALPRYTAQRRRDTPSGTTTTTSSVRLGNYSPTYATTTAASFKGIVFGA